MWGGVQSWLNCSRTPSLLSSHSAIFAILACCLVAPRWPLQPQTWDLYSRLRVKWEGLVVPAFSVSFYPEMKMFSSVITPRSLLSPHWSEWCHMTSSGCNAGWEKDHRERQVGKEPRVGMGVGGTSPQCLSQIVSLGQGHGTKRLQKFHGQWVSLPHSSCHHRLTWRAWHSPSLSESLTGFANTNKNISIYKT